MRKIIFTFWMDASDKHPDGAKLTVKVVPNLESDHRPELSFMANGQGGISIETLEYEIVDNETVDGWNKLLSLSFDGAVLSINSKLRDQRYFHIDLPKVVRE